MVGGTYYGGWPGRWWLPALKPAAPLQGAPFRRDMRDLRESIVRSPAQAWRAVVMAAREMQRSTCPQSAVRSGVRKQARASLNPRTSMPPSAEGRAGVPTDSADSLPTASVCADPYLSQIFDKDFLSVLQTLILCLRSLNGPFPLGKPCLAGLAG